jgi:hypothetical protein
MLDEGAEDPSVQIGHDEFSIDEDIGFQHSDASLLDGVMKRPMAGASL